jgi:enolase
MAVTIASVKARQIFDSRGNPTVEVRGEIDRGGKGVVLCPFCTSLCVW